MSFHPIKKLFPNAIIMLLMISEVATDVIFSADSYSSSCSVLSTTFEKTLIYTGKVREVA